LGAQPGYRRGKRSVGVKGNIEKTVCKRRCVRKQEFEVTLRKKMEKLEQIKVIASNLKTGSAKAVRALHRFVFEQEGNRNNRKRLREFEGFSFVSGSDEHRAKLAYVDASLGWGDLVSICNVLAIDYSGTKKELSQRICNYLMDLNSERSKQRRKRRRRR